MCHFRSARGAIKMFAESVVQQAENDVSLQNRDTETGSRKRERKLFSRAPTNLKCAKGMKIYVVFDFYCVDSCAISIKLT